MDCSGVDVKNTFSPKIWQNSSMIHLDFVSSKCSQLTDTLLSPLFQYSHPKSFLLLSPEPLHTLLSLNRNSPGSPAGASQMCFRSALEDGEQVVEPNHNLSPLLHGLSTRDWHADTKSFSSGLAPHWNRKNNALNQTWAGDVEEIQEGLTIQSLWHLSQHVSLANRASCLQQRLLAVLGEHASRHYNHQIQSLKKKRCSPSYSMTSELLSETINAIEMQEVEQALDRNLQFPHAHKRFVKSRDLQDLEHNGHAVLQGLLESLDSDATVSSSDEEWDHEDTKETLVKTCCDVCEERWLRDRGELCSRWTWLQMRLSELDSQIQWLGKLQQQILSNKGHVVLAESQPLTDRQIQHTLWTETMDLSFTAGNMQDLHSDPEMEPSSPTRLLRNIERQSAQLTRIVNSLMPSLCASPSSSPVSKGTCSRWRGQQKTACSSQMTHTSVFVPSGECLHKVRQKRKRTCHKRQQHLQVDISCMSARTRPLLTFHKPRLFIMESLPHNEQVLEYSSLFSSGASCDPSSLYTGPVFPHRKERTEGKVHPVLSLSSETPTPCHLQNALFEESVLQRSLFSKTDYSSPHHGLRSRGKVSRSLFHCNHWPRKRRFFKRHGGERTRLWARKRHSPAYSKDKRRRCSNQTTDMQISSITPNSGVLSLSDDSHLEESSEDMSVSYCTQSQQRNSQFPLRRRNCESIFSFDDIVIPMSLFTSVKVERPQCKNILTPSWRKVDISPLLKKEEAELEVKRSEVTEDEDFNQRHQSYERKERLHWSSWDQHSRHAIRSHTCKRSCSSVSVRAHPAHCHPPEHGPVLSTWTFSPSATEVSVGDTEPSPPWTRRLFPLTDEDEETLRLPSTTSEMDLEMMSH